MNRTGRNGLLVASLLAAGTALTCGGDGTAGCPEIACEPAISIQYRQPVSGDYALLIVLQTVTYQVTCPSAGGPSTSPPHLTCDANGFVLAGVDLGHGDNEELEMMVELITGDAAITYPVTATLMSITNSMDCELVCYQHTGTVGN